MSIQDVAIRLLARREHSALELKRKLLARDFEQQEVNDCVTILIDNNLLSDLRFAGAFIRSKVARGKGYEHIRAGLISRGVSREIVLSSLESCGVSWLALASQVLQKKFGADACISGGDQARKQRFLSYRGFRTETIWRVFSVDD
jgi:regulatory protein